MHLINLTIIIKSGGEVGSAVAHRLFQSNFRNICLTEVSNPNPVSRGVTFAEAICDGEKKVEGITARLVPSFVQIKEMWANNIIPIIVDPKATIITQLHPDIVIDAIMAKKNLGTHLNDATLVIGLGPGFNAGKDVHIVIETNNSEQLGKVILSGEAESNTGLPVIIDGYASERVAHAENTGIFKSDKAIGDIVQAGDVIASAGNDIFRAQISGMIRAILRNGIQVQKGVKLFEIDPVADLTICNSIRSRMRAIAGGVLEAILMKYNN